MKTRFLATLLGSLALGIPCLADDLALELPRHAYLRGEQIPVTMKGPDIVTGSAFEILLGDRQVVTGTAAGPTMTTPVPTADFKVGPYELKAMIHGAGRIFSGTAQVTVARKPSPDRIEIWLWGGGNEYYVEHGFTFGGGPSWCYYHEKDRAKHLETLDGHLARGAYATIYPCGGIACRDLKGIDPSADDVAYRGAGRHEEDYFNPFSPEVERVRRASNDKFMEAIGGHPAVKVAFYNTEQVDNLWLDNLNREGVELTRRRLGFTRSERGKPRFVAPGVLADDDRGYRFQKYVYTEGSGLAYANRRTAEDVKRFRPDVWTLTDPYRSATLLGMFPGLDLVGTWTYTNNDPKLMLYVETMRAVTRGTGQLPLETVTMLNYPGALAPRSVTGPKEGLAPPGVAPAHVGWMLMGPDRCKEVSWIILSRAPKLIGYYYSSACNPQKYNRPEDQFRVPHATSDAIRELSDRVYKPYGPMITRLAVARRGIAVLSSQASRLYGTSPRTIGYPNEQIYGFYSVMAMAQLNADVVFDQQVEQGILKDYQVLVMPKCDVVTQKMLGEIRALAQRGGKLISDQYLGPELPGVTRFDFDFTYRPKVNADAIERGAMFADWDDHLNPKTASLAAARGVTADEDQRIMESYARRLKAGLAGRVDPEVELDTPKALVNVLEHGGVRYLVLVNDHRGYDDRTGRYKAIMEKLLPQKVTVTLRNWTGPLHAYDMLGRKLLPAAKTPAGLSFAVDLDALGGKLVALYPTRPAKLEIAAPARKLSIAIRDDQGKPLGGLQPLEVTVTDAKGAATEYTDYYAAANGELDIPLHPAVNDAPGPWRVRVEDLTAGLTAERTFNVQQTPASSPDR
jgi:hypothetical protein